MTKCFACVISGLGSQGRRHCRGPRSHAADRDDAHLEAPGRRDGKREVGDRRVQLGGELILEVRGHLLGLHRLSILAQG